MKKTKIAVITGASGGLGQALAREFSKNWKVIGTGRSPRPKSLVEAADYYQFDASESSACEAFWKHLNEEYPAADVCLVNNAGGYINGAFLKLASHDYEQQMKSSFFSSVCMTRELTQVYSKAKIINIVSASALRPHKNGSAYGSAKAAQMHFFQSLQDELDPARYAITNLYPNNIATSGPAEHAMTPEDLAIFVREQAENNRTYYLRDVTITAK